MVNGKSLIAFYHYQLTTPIYQLLRSLLIVFAWFVMFCNETVTLNSHNLRHLSDAHQDLPHVH